MAKEPKNTFAAKDFTDLVSICVRIGLTNKHQYVWWRGQSRDEGWDLVPRVHRLPLSERLLVPRFMQKVHACHNDCPRQDDYLGWLVLMQHYSFPTRLLDWTESPLFAAFFACDNVFDADKRNKEENAVIWGLLPCTLNYSHTQRLELLNANDKLLLYLVHEPFIEFTNTVTTIRPDTKEVLDTKAQVVGTAAIVEASKMFPVIDPARGGSYDIPPNTIKTVAALNAPCCHARMSSQLSRFTIHGDRIPLIEYPNADDFLCKIRIPAKLKDEIRQRLHVVGVRRSSLFSDLTNLAIEVQDEVEEIMNLLKGDTTPISEPDTPPSDPQEHGFVNTETTL